MGKTYEASGKTLDAAIDAACALAGNTIDNLDIEVLDYGTKGLFGIGGKDYRVSVTTRDADAAEEKKPLFAQTPVNEFQTVLDVKPLTPEERAAEQKRREEKKARYGDKRGGRGGRDRDRAQRRADGDKPTRPEPEERAPRPERERRESHAAEISAGEMADGIKEQALAFLQPIFASFMIEPRIKDEIKDGILWLTCSGDNLGILIGRRGETLNSLQYLVNLAVNKTRSEHVRIVLDVEGYRQSREETLTALAHKMAEKAVKNGRRVELEPMNPHERRIVHIALQNDRRVETSSHGEEPYRKVVIYKKRTKQH
ncbi:MAG: RNA-binding cell elongation regulator Jag/EloR [Bacillota bacterium]|nr:RNA-binding cell elongation regulator Jag/EloR [Bacillota bacterium]